jgi:hypothetical protein
MDTKFTKWSQNIPSVRKIFQMAIKCIDIFQSKALHNLPKLRFLVWKYTIWQPCLNLVLLRSKRKHRWNYFLPNAIVTSRVARWYMYFHTKNPALGIFWSAMGWKISVYCISIWNILRLFGIFCGHLVYFSTFWYILPRKNLATLVTSLKRPARVQSWGKTAAK